VGIDTNERPMVVRAKRAEPGGRLVVGESYELC
jgi:hypothetical protein